MDTLIRAVLASPSTPSGTSPLFQSLFMSVHPSRRKKGKKPKKRRPY